MKKCVFNGLFLTLAILSAIACSQSQNTINENDTLTVEEKSDSPLGFEPDSLEVVEGRVRSGEFFSTLLMRLGLSAADAYRLTEACSEEFDVRTLRVGNEYQAYYAADTTGGAAGQGRLQYLVYEKDNVNSLVFHCTEPFKVEKSAKPVVTERKYADVTISSSLWNDMLAADVSPLLILSLSDVYAWTVDFFGLQKGDRFKVVYDQKVCEGKVLAVDTVRYAVFSHGGDDFPAIMFNQGDGGNIYWNEKGESMRKAFLKAPLKFSRISSGFSYARKHPVTRRVQPHTGVDYAAPTGTPVMSIGDGVVTSRKYEGAGGNTVRIRHNSVYSTAYLHLSKFASGIVPGKRVRQGEVIGYVGATGRCTGPHLDFRVWKNGSPINPLKMQSPPAEPLKKENREAFKSAAREYQHEMDVLLSQKVVSGLFELL